MNFRSETRSDDFQVESLKATEVDVFLGGADPFPGRRCDLSLFLVQHILFSVGKRVWGHIYIMIVACEEEDI